MIHPNPELTSDQAREHATQFRIKSPVVIDTNQVISRRVGATVTPQAFVFVRDQKTPVYEGRIDNLYAGYGKKRNVATTRDLAAALEAVVAGRPAKESKTEAVGCYISYSEVPPAAK
jgi:predicted dinucleotide-utilizing enzyme